MFHDMGQYHPLVRPGKSHVSGLLHHPGILLHQKIFLKNHPRILKKTLHHRTADSLCLFLSGIARNLHLYRQRRSWALQRYFQIDSEIA